MHSTSIPGFEGFSNGAPDRSDTDRLETRPTVPLATILADIGDAWEYEPNRAMLARWYWNGVFGDLYESAVETRVARDFMEVPVWLKGGPEPSTVRETMFRADRLKTMRMRVSVAYKGMERANATTRPIDRGRLDGYLASHLIDPSLLRVNSFDTFMSDRQKKLLALIERATGRAAYIGDVPDEGEDDAADEDAIEAERTMAVG